MRLLAFFAFLLSVHICHAQFNTNPNGMCNARYVNNMYELAEDTAVQGLDIFPMQFSMPSDTEDYKTPTLYNLECIYYEFSFSPDSSEASKKQFISDLKYRLDFFEYLLRNPNVKAVYFHIGEKIFMSDAEIKKGGNNWQKKADMNLKNAWKEFGARLQMKYPHLKFYAENWNW